MQSSEAPLKIDLHDLERYKRTAADLLNRAEHTVRTKTRDRGLAIGGSERSHRDVKSLIEIARLVGGDNAVLIEDMVNHSLHVVRRGVELGAHISELYKKASGLDALIQQQKRTEGFKTEAQRAEFNEKQQTTAHVLRFVCAHYVLWELSGFRTEVVDSVSVPELEVPELEYGTQRTSLASMMYFYADTLEEFEVKTPEAFVKVTKVYFEKILEDVKARVSSIKYPEPFVERAYQLEGSEFTVHGFEVEAREQAASAEFKRLSFEEIVGNRIAKHEARRMVFRICCYDPVTERNPFRELTGSLQCVRLASGVPGTGKSMQIAATATLFADTCDLIGIPFVYHPLPNTIISTFQGGSAERMDAWFRIFHNPKQIVYGPIDDAEQALQDRTMQGVSAGVREVVSGFLVGTEGAGAVYVPRGMSLIEVFTNIPDQIDPAVLSRLQSRFPIDGARRWEDFLDQDYLWWKHFKDAVPEFFGDMQSPSDYKYMSLQTKLESLAETLENYDAPNNPTMRAIFEQVGKDHDVRDLKFYAVLYEAVQDEFPGFSSRETRNIQSAISARMVDFDAPDVWMEDADTFFRKDYDAKLVLLRDLMHQNMGGLKMQDIWVQEVSRYLDSYAEIAETQFRREVDAEVKRHEVSRQAQRELGAAIEK